MLLSLLGMQAATGTAAQATTSQFHGLNWADPNDNFVTGHLQPVGLSDTDSYATVCAKWTWYTAAFDAATALGMNVVLTPWLQNGVIGDSNAFDAMWDTVINKYASNSRVYFGIMNEPWGYSNTDEDNLAAAQVARYSQIPRGRIIVPGAWEGNLCTVGGAKCLDAAGNQTTAGTPVEIWDCNGGTNQQWTVNANGTIIGVQSGLCLDVTGSSTTNGAKIELWNCTGGSNQQWKLG
jgi:hypothetical protein